MVCPHNLRHYKRRIDEIHGLDWDGVPETPDLPLPELPNVIPLIAHGYRRVGLLEEPVVSLSLFDLFSRKAGALRDADRSGMTKRFRLPKSAMIVASGVGDDDVVEGWWRLRRMDDVLAGLRTLGISFATTPNFSVLARGPREDNLHAMKRIALTWAWFTRAGIPTGLHLNARTERDYERWAEFISARPAVRAVAFETGTACGRAARIGWHLDQLTKLRRAVGRPLTLVLRGRTGPFVRLCGSFDKVVFIETTSFMKTVKRRRARFVTGRILWEPSPTEAGKPLDALLAHNIRLVRKEHEIPPATLTPRVVDPRNAA
jgi:hypothetical protein